MSAMRLSPEELRLYSGIVRNLSKFLVEWDITGKARLYDYNGSIILNTDEGYMTIHDIMGDYEADICVADDYLLRLRYFIVATVIDLSKKVSYPVDGIEFVIQSGYSGGIKQVGDGKTYIYLE